VEELLKKLTKLGNVSGEQGSEDLTPIRTELLPLGGASVSSINLIVLPQRRLALALARIHLPHRQWHPGIAGIPRPSPACLTRPR